MTTDKGIPLRVLIVEDSDDDARLVVNELRRGGYAPAYARVDTHEALRVALDKQEWDLVISDYTMIWTSRVILLASSTISSCPIKSDRSMCYDSQVISPIQIRRLQFDKSRNWEIIPNYGHN